jgi:acetyl-CoA carboxylase carboxyltransferase component
MSHPEVTGASWQGEIDELEQRRARARELGGPERIQRQHDRRKLTARERIDYLLDEGTFDEIGLLADHGSHRPDMADVTAPADGVVCGAGEIDGRPVYLFSEDFTVLGGSVGQVGFRKRMRVRELAQRDRVPLLFLLDGAGARGQEYTMGEWPSGEHFALQAQMSGVVPQVAAILGGLGGDPALEVPLTDFKVMTKHEGMVAAGGPPLVESATGIKVTKQELGGYKVHTERSGVVDNAVDSDEEALDQVRTFLSYLPSNCWELPPRRDSFEDPFRRDEALADVIPRERTRPYDVMRVIEGLIDHDSFFMIQPRYGRALVVGLARIDGEVVGIQANQPKWRAGAFGAQEADKATHFVALCNSYNIPMIFLSDVPGFMVGPKSEEEATLRRGLRLAWTMSYMRVPTISVLLRKAYGMGSVAMHSANAGQVATLAWPSAEFGALPLDGGVKAAYKRTLDEEQTAEEIEAVKERFAAFGNPLDAAKAFNFDDLIDPRDTRKRIVRALRRARAAQAQQLGPWRHHGIFP